MTRSQRSWSMAFQNTLPLHHASRWTDVRGHCFIARLDSVVNLAWNPGCRSDSRQIGADLLDRLPERTQSPTRSRKDSAVLLDGEIVYLNMKVFIENFRTSSPHKKRLGVMSFPGLLHSCNFRSLPVLKNPILREMLPASTTHQYLNRFVPLPHCGHDMPTSEMRGLTETMTPS